MTSTPAESPTFDRDAFLHDSENGARAIGAPFDRNVTRRMTDLFEREFRDGVIQFRIASVEGSPINYRVLCLPDVDWVARAEETGTLLTTKAATTAGERISRLLPELRERFPASFYLGADFDASTGLEKIYLLFLKPVPLDEFLKTESLPPGLRGSRAVLEAHDMREVVICAVDVVKGSVNVYFVWRKPSAAWLDGFATAWRHDPIPAPLKEEILRSTPFHGSVASTWSFNEASPKRWCVYAIALRYDHPEVYQKGGQLDGYVLPPLHDRFSTFDRAVGTQTNFIAYGLGWSFGAPFHYLKYERSYTKDLLKHYLAQTDSANHE